MADGLAALGVVESAEFAVEQMSHAFRGSEICLLGGFGAVGDRYRWLALGPGFEGTLLVFGTTFVAVHIGDVGFDPGEVISESVQNRSNGFGCFLGDRAAADVLVGEDLDLHGISNLSE
ncbi:hypothetical protein [Nocardia seriolae]|uniref:hypothetical protein n=1 Tax=Nocardia seriolae TaxID=37332 RepID=UPI001319BF39|nr:hypothetical protein [Nocardia seriolae]QOW30685.1 hypothetical protein IMZ23_21155 [Nocardia seriolae]QUN15387.1 hypothetical protein KEC46_23745 [Nocardia seriolae]WNJ57623.1 hypothetical protein RMO66_30100 [Nocardia seriolae]